MASVHGQWVRCGKGGCRCSQGALHGPYHYVFWREHGRLRKRYVRAPRVAEVIAECEAEREQRLRDRLERAASLAHWRELLAAVRDLERDA